MTLSKNFLQRLLTALLGASFLVSVLWWGGHWGARVFALVMALAMTLEFSNLFLKLNDAKVKKYTLIFFVTLAHFIDALIYDQHFVIICLLFVTMFAFNTWRMKWHDASEFKDHLLESVWMGFGVLYLAGLPLLIPMIYDLGPTFVLFFLLIVWAGDIGAYLFGKSFGKNKLFEIVSPGKTIEGAVGGLLMSLIVGNLSAIYLAPKETLLTVNITTVLVYFSSQIGDLCESLIKRGVGAKDSGGILPGHGGFLDRFDGVVFALPVMYTCIIVLT